MTIVTIMDYDWSELRWMLLARMWMAAVQANAVRGTAESLAITVIANVMPAHMQRYLAHFANVTVVPVQQAADGDWWIRTKLWNLSQQLGPHIYLDMDAIVLQPLTILWGERLNRPITFAPEANPRADFPGCLNAGVYVSNGNGFMDYAVIKSRWTAQLTTGSYMDQGALMSWLESSAIDWRSPNIGIQHNAPAGRCIFTKGVRWTATIDGANVAIAHHYNQDRPWSINSPILAELIDQLLP